MKEEYIIEIIKNEWADIHHTRNQEWTSLAIIGGVFWALFTAPTDELKIVIALFGLIACFFIILMLHRHWKLFRKKITFIKLLQKEMGIEFKFYKNKEEEERAKIISVQSIIMFLYSLLFSALAGAFVWYKFQKFVPFLVVSGVIFVLGIAMCFCYFPKSIEKKAKEVEIDFIDPSNGEVKTLKLEEKK